MVKKRSTIPVKRAQTPPIDAVWHQGVKVYHRLDGMKRILEANKGFFDGTLTHFPETTLNDLMAEDDPFIPFCESLLYNEVGLDKMQSLRKLFSDIENRATQVFGQIHKEAHIRVAEELIDSFHQLLSEFLKGKPPLGVKRFDWIASLAHNTIIGWIFLGYSVELHEEEVLRQAMSAPGFNRNAVGERIQLMKAHDMWDVDFRRYLDDPACNSAVFFIELLCMVSFLDPESSNFFDYNKDGRRGSCRNDLLLALSANTRHSPFDKSVPAQASFWIELARTRMLNSLASVFSQRIASDRDYRDARDLWKELHGMMRPNKDDIKVVFTADEAAIIVRLAEVAADHVRDRSEADAEYDNVLPLATFEPTEEPGVDLCDIRPLRDHPFKWRGTVVAWHERLKKRIPIALNTEVADEQIHLVTFQALEYYRILAPRAPYLRGETDERPPPVKDAGGKLHELGFLLTSSIEPCILRPMTKLIEQLPALNAPDKDYPIEKLEDMFKALNLLATMMNHCEEELSSVEGENLGDIVTDTLLLQRLVCPKRNGRGRFVLERDLIAKTYADFYKSMLTAVLCVKRKVDKRDNKTIELGELKQEIEEMRKKSAKKREDLNADRLRDTQKEAFSNVANNGASWNLSSCSDAPTPRLENALSASKGSGEPTQSKNALSASKGASRSGERSAECGVRSAKKGEKGLGIRDQGLGDAADVGSHGVDGPDASGKIERGLGQKGIGYAHAEICFSQIEQAVKGIDDIITRLDQPFQTEEDVEVERESVEMRQRLAKKGIAFPDISLPPGRDCFDILIPFCEQFFETRRMAGEEIKNKDFAERIIDDLVQLRKKWDQLTDRLKAKLPEETAPIALKCALAEMHEQFVSRFGGGDGSVNVAAFQENYEKIASLISIVSKALGRKYGVVRNSDGGRNPFVWDERAERIFKDLENSVGDDPEKWTTVEHISYVAYCALDYYRTIIEWIPYLRGEADERPALKKCGDGVERNVGDWVVATIQPTILKSVHLIIKNLPQLNRPGAGYPIDKLERMFLSLNGFAMAMNQCEEEVKSTEGSMLGLAFARNSELHHFVCPPLTPDGKVVLERELIAKAYVNFHKSFCNAAHALADKVKKREAATIDIEMPRPDPVLPEEDADASEDYPVQNDEASAAVCYYKIEDAIKSIDEIIGLLSRPSPIRYKIDKEKFCTYKAKLGPGERKTFEEVAEKLSTKGFTWSDLILPTGYHCSTVLIPFGEDFFDSRRLAGEEINNPKFNEKRAEFLPILRSKLDDLADKLSEMLPGESSPTLLKFAIGDVYDLFNLRFLFGDGRIDLAAYKAKYENFRLALANTSAALGKLTNGKEREESAKSGVNAEVLSRLDALKAGQTEVKEGLSDLKGGQAELKSGQGKTHDLLGSIKGFFPGLVSRLRTIQKTVDGNHTKITEKSRANEKRVKKAVGLYYTLVKEGMAERNATTEACNKVDDEMGHGDYSSIATFRNAVDREIKERQRHYGDRAAKVFFEENRE